MYQVANIQVQASNKTAVTYVVKNFLFQAEELQFSHIAFKGNKKTRTAGVCLDSHLVNNLLIFWFCSIQSVVYTCTFTEYYSVTKNFFIANLFTTEGCQKVTWKN